MESLRQLQNALQNERSAMKMRENKLQGEYAELTLTWKQKQSEACIIVSDITTQVANLNARLLQLNQEYTLLRQRQMQQQLEANYQKEEKRVARDSRQLMYRSRKWKEWERELRSCTNLRHKWSMIVRGPKGCLFLSIKPRSHAQADNQNMRSTNLLLILAVASSVYLQNESQIAPK